MNNQDEIMTQNPTSDEVEDLQKQITTLEETIKEKDNVINVLISEIRTKDAYAQKVQGLYNKLLEEYLGPYTLLPQQPQQEQNNEDAQ